MASIALKTFKGGSVTPQDDAIIYQTVIGTNGVFKGCAVTHTGSNILHISQGFGMIKGRFFEVYETDVYVTLNSSSETIEGRLYIHMDLSNADEPLQILTRTAAALPDLDADEDVNYNNSSYDLELAVFNVSNTALTNLTMTCPKITGASGASASSLQRSKEYSLGDFATCSGAPGWVTLYCIQGGTTAAAEPEEYGGILEIGDIVADGGCIFAARDVIGELDALGEALAETQDSVRELEDELTNQAGSLPAKIGDIRYTASENVDSDWLKCDGSFITETDYPELVAALGKVSPGVDEFSVLYTDDANGLISNSVVCSGKLWAYFVARQKLIGLDSDGNKTEISVSGADALVNSAASPVTLSLCGGSMYLAQDAQSAFTFLECASADLSGSSIKMTDCTSALSGKVSSLSYRDLAYPSVSDISGTKYMALGTTSAQAALVLSGSTSYKSDFLNVLAWTAGSLSAGTVKTYEFRVNTYSTSSSNFSATITEHMSRTLLGFHAKNHAELVMEYTYVSSYNKAIFGYASPYSIPLGTFGLQSNVNQGYISTGSWAAGGTTAEKFYTDGYSLSLNTLAVSANGECLYSAQIIDGALWLMYGSYDPVKANVIAQAEGISLSSKANLFPESVCYLDYQSLWMVFLGTGIAFSTKLDGGTWGYLDTSEVLGVITANGCLTYDADTNVLYVSGTTSGGVPKIAKMYLRDLYEYASDGAWLPLLASDGVPAYIKAKETTA